jgi:O-antigen/teichoic acid export membrane protein
MLESMALGIDKVLVSILCEPDQFAVFVNGAMEIPFIRMITAATMAVILPEIVAFYKTGKKAEALGLWQRSARKIAVLLLPLGGLLFVAAPELMTLFYSGEYVESSRPFRIYLLLLPARVIFFGVIFQAAGRSDLILKRAVGTLLLNAAVSYPMIKYFGIEGAAWGTVVVFWLYVIPYCLAYCSRLLDTVWFRLMPFRHLGMILLAIVGAMLVASQMRPFLPAGHTLSVAVLVSAGYVVILMPALILLCRAELRQYWQMLLRVLPGNRGRS